MSNEEKFGYDFGPAIPLTLSALEALKKKGFKYVIVHAFAHDRRPDYMEPRYFVLQPVKELPEDVNKKGIYEPIESPLLAEWATFPHEGVKVLITKG